MKQRMSVQIGRFYAARGALFGGIVLLAFTPSALMAQVADAAQSGAVGVQQPMASEAHPGFLVVTIKPSDPNAAPKSLPTGGRHISFADASVSTLIMLAYRIHPKQIVGGPDWISSDHYDISGVPDVPGVPSLPQMQEMVQKLLADRLHLAFHREIREMPVYAITVAKGGPSLKAADSKEPVNTGETINAGRRTLRFTNMSMSDFVLNMNFYEDRPIIDQTSLPGRYDFTLKWTYDLSKEGESDAPPSIFTAIREQLGLNMTAVKGPAEVFVIDSIERPSEN